MNRIKILLAAALVVLIYCYFVLDLDQYLSLDFFKSQQVAIDTYYRAHSVQAALIYVLVYVAVTALSLPGAALLTLVGGAVFGLVLGTALVSLASTLGATLAFLVSRFLLRDAVQNRFGESLVTFNDGIEKDGAFYLFTLRLVPAFPFFVINLVMGLTRIPAWTYIWVSWVGMLAGTVVYVNAGTQIAALESLAGILSPALVASFTLLGLLPLIAKKALELIRRRRVYHDYPRPADIDYDMVVIGAGAAGLTSAYLGAVLKARVAIVERNRMGGDCLNTGCVPSKALIRSAKFLHTARNAQALGIRQVSVDFDFAAIMERVQDVIRAVEPHDSVDRYATLGVECVQGSAEILSPFEVRVGDRTLRTRNIVIATGGRPAVPALPGIEDCGYLTSDTLWDLRVLPKRLVVLGGGPIGCELSQAFARLGSQVTQVETLPRLLMREDPEISDLIVESFREEGIEVLLEHRAIEIVTLDDGCKILVCERDGRRSKVEFDQLLVATGRRAQSEHLGLAKLGIGLTEQRTVAVNEYLQTVFPNIYACGDVAGPYQFTHTASHQAWYVVVNALFGHLKRFRVDYSVIPWATFCDPEVARVGLNELEARQRGIDYEVTRYGLDDLDRALADSTDRGMVKVLTQPGRDRILGATIVGEHAADLIVEFIAAMRHGFGLNKILGTIHIYPTLAEANKLAAGEWKRAHAPERLLRWVERYHAWRRR